MKNAKRSTAALAAWTLLAGSAWAQTLFNYSGADRMEKIVAAAKKEGTLTMYTTFAVGSVPVCALTSMSPGGRFSPTRRHPTP